MPQHRHAFLLSDSAFATPPPTDRQRALLDTLTSIKPQVYSRRTEVQSTLERFHDLVRVYIDHALDPLHCALPHNPVAVRPKLIPHVSTGPVTTSRLVCRVASASLGWHGITEERFRLLAFRGIQADQMTSALAQPPAGVTHLELSMRGEGLQSVLAVPVPRYLPSVCAKPWPLEMRDNSSPSLRPGPTRGR